MKRMESGTGTLKNPIEIKDEIYVVQTGKWKLPSVYKYDVSESPEIPCILYIQIRYLVSRLRHFLSPCQLFFGSDESFFPLANVRTVPDPVRASEIRGLCVARRWTLLCVVGVSSPCILFFRSRSIQLPSVAFFSPTYCPFSWFLTKKNEKCKINSPLALPRPIVDWPINRIPSMGCQHST